jgi:hypothetical protein
MDPKRDLIEDPGAVGEEDGSTGGNTASQNFYKPSDNSTAKKSYPDQSPRPMIPDKMTSTLNVYNTLSNKIDPIKSQVNEGRTSYLETIKEESEMRRTRFYKSNLAQIYA